MTPRVKYNRKRRPSICTRVIDDRYDTNLPIGGVDYSTDVPCGVDVTFYYYDDYSYNGGKWYDNCVYYDFPDTEEGEEACDEWLSYLMDRIKYEQELFKKTVVDADYDDDDW